MYEHEISSPYYLFQPDTIRALIYITTAYRLMPTRRSVKNVSRTRSVVGTTIDANDWPMEGEKVGT